MDPISQLGWGTPQAAMGDGTARLVRDVFAAGDTVHEAALMEMGVDSNDETDSRDGTTGAEGDASTAVAQTTACSEVGYMEGIVHAA